MPAPPAPSGVPSAPVVAPAPMVGPAPVGWARGPPPALVPAPAVAVVPPPAPAPAPAPVAAIPDWIHICKVTAQDGGVNYLHISSAQAHDWSACGDGPEAFGNSVDTLLQQSGMDRRCFLPETTDTSIAVYSSTGKNLTDAQRLLRRPGRQELDPDPSEPSVGCWRCPSWLRSARDRRRRRLQSGAPCRRSDEHRSRHRWLYRPGDK